MPNTELGHLEIDGFDAEKRAAASVRTAENLSYDQYVPRLQRYYETLEALFWPDLIVVGGGVSKNAEKFLPKLKLKTPIVPAVLMNKAGSSAPRHWQRRRRPSTTAELGFRRVDATSGLAGACLRGRRSPGWIDASSSHWLLHWGQSA